MDEDDKAGYMRDEIKSFVKNNPNAIASLSKKKSLYLRDTKYDISFLSLAIKLIKMELE